MGDVGLDLVARDAERLRLEDAVHGAREGLPAALLLHGEAGIGKTALVRQILLEMDAGAFHVLFASCLRFGAEGAALLPLTTSLTAWLRQSDPAQRARIFPGARRGEELVTAASDQGGSSAAVLQWSRALDALVDDRPTVLVVDDLQWADQSTLDALTYVITGFTSGLRLTVVGTYRDTDLQDGHRLRAWLADVRRLPEVDSLALGRLDVWATEELVSTLVPAARTGEVADWVFERSRGNPYLTELLVESLGDASTEPAPTDLRDAVLGAWHRLGPVARKVTQLLAVAGLPVSAQVLQGLAAQLGIGSGDVTAALGEATGKGVVQAGTGSDVWFVHPLFADVIAGTQSAWEVADLHLRYAALWAEAPATSERERSHRLALHYEAAGRFDEAFGWSLQAADEADRVGATDVAAIHLASAAELLPRLSRPATEGEDSVDLLRRAAEMCERAGRYDQALTLYERALKVVDRVERPLDAARMLLPLPILRAYLGQGWEASPEEWLECIRLCEGMGPTAEEAMARANIAFGQVFSGDAQAKTHAELALTLARQTGSNAAVAWARAVLSQTGWGTDLGLNLSLSALELAGSVGDTTLVARIAVLTTNSYQSLGRHAEAASVAVDTYTEILNQGQRHDAAHIGAVGAQLLLALGRFAEAQSLVREIVSFREGRRWSGEARCVAAIISARRGEDEAARRHLQRAHELMPGHQPVGYPLSWAEMQVSVDAGRPAEALEVAEVVMAKAAAIDAPTADEYLLWSARAAADLAGASVTAAQRTVAEQRLLALEDIRATNPSSPFARCGDHDLVHPAYLAMYEADRARCLETLEPAHLWESALAATQDAGLSYEQARCGMHLARRLLAETGQRQQARLELRTSARVAAQLGATQLLEAIQRLADQAHVDLIEPVAARADDKVTTVAGVSLTERESEVLAHLVAGETYREIAHALYISEKTVSSHVSRLLRKTGSHGRIELVDAAQRERRQDSVSPVQAKPTTRG